MSPVGQPMGMARASAGPLPPISADSRDQFGSCLSLQDSQQQQHIREEPTRGRGYVLLDDLQGTMSDSEGKKQTCHIVTLFLLIVSSLRVSGYGLSCLHLVLLCTIFSCCVFTESLHVSVGISHVFIFNLNLVNVSSFCFWVSVLLVNQLISGVHACLCTFCSMSYRVRLNVSLCMHCVSVCIPDIV